MLDSTVFKHPNAVPIQVIHHLQMQPVLTEDFLLQTLQSVVIKRMKLKILFHVKANLDTSKLGKIL